MSGEGPDSIPTSHDPRSKRPLKKRALSPRSQTAADLSALFSHPEKSIPLAPSTSLVPQTNTHNPPEIVQNVQGSSAGAGSGEFHVYKASRRREYERLRGMEEEVRKEEEGEKWEREKREREERDREKTRKNRERRERLKNKKGKGGKGDGKTGEETGGKIKARVDVRDGAEGLGGEGPVDGDGDGDRNREQVGGAAPAAEEVGLVVVDDD